MLSTPALPWTYCFSCAPYEFTIQMRSDDTHDPGRTRTANLRLRRPALFPIELRSHSVHAIDNGDRSDLNRCPRRHRPVSSPARRRPHSPWEDSNLRPLVPEASALPLSYTVHEKNTTHHAVDGNRTRVCRSTTGCDGRYTTTAFSCAHQPPLSRDAIRSNSSDREGFEPSTSRFKAARSAD